MAVTARTDLPTQTSFSPGPSSPHPPPSGDRNATGPGKARFLPGAVLGGRYRIVGLLGRGGMGEVYRADDLKLGQPVALKFLPAGLEHDADRLSRFLNEVKLARRVSHPSVCRVYDVGEVGGQHYLSMEYVDGEDLASLLRRIGRLPKDKAVELARQLCAGLAAAHDEGILHRDLKPANVMIDGRGRARITDFGLASLPGTVHGKEVRVGTPAYMAPEQLAGREVSVRSDIYALGLVLYELFCGKPAFDPTGGAERVRGPTASTPTSPSSLVEGFDPAVERILLRCLDADPVRRPASALSVAAALPGGDPLAAALAAGETPSPELVAAQGAAEAMHPSVALSLAVLIVAGVVAAGLLNGTHSLRSALPMDKPPAAMVDRARDVIKELGFTEPIYADPQDAAFGYSIWRPALDGIWKQIEPDKRRDLLRSDNAYVASFWYRQSPLTMHPVPSRFGTFVGEHVERWNPFPQITGGMLVSLSLAGRLEFFARAPRRFQPDTDDSVEPDWSVPFRLSGLNIEDFKAVKPRYQRFMAPDHRAAWVGFRPGMAERQVRIEAGTSEGRLCLWAILDATELDQLAGEPESLEEAGANRLMFIWMITVVLVGGGVLARFNLRRGRADQRGAWRLGIAALLILLPGTLLSAHDLTTRYAVIAIYPVAGTTLFVATLLTVLYLGVEPYARRVWPSMLVSWSRLMSRTSRTWRDPLIGRSVLGGLAAGTGLLFLTFFVTGAVWWVKGEPVKPSVGNWSVILGQRYALAEILGDTMDSLGQALSLALWLVLARMLVRRSWLAVPVGGLFYMFMGGVPIGDSLGATLFFTGVSALVTAIHIAVLLRFGLVGLLVTIYVDSIARMTSTTDWTAWHAQPAVLALAVILALVVYGHWAATAGRRFALDELPAAS
ncbi:MAG: serine/threonine-protein kinase [Acidobacteriota bacterium]